MASSLTERGNGWDKLKKSLKKAGDMEVVVGVLGPINFGIPTTAAIGAVHEFGSTDGSIPERSFLRSTFDRNERKYEKQAEKMMGEGLKKGKGVGAGALFKLGEVVRADVIDSIRKKLIPQDPKGLGNKPEGTALVDTGNLVGSIVSVTRKASK